MSLFQELKRRNVFRVGIAWVLMGWVVLQGADFVLDLVGAPDWVIRAMAVVGVAGLPIALFFAWAFEVTPEGIKREAEVDRSRSITPHTGRKLDRAIIVFLAAALVLVLGERFLGGNGQSAVPGALQTSAAPAAGEPVSTATAGEAPGATGEGPVSVAVLPFLNMSDEADNEYFSDGISEELLNVLVRIDGLRVPSRTSSFTFKGSNKKLDEIGRELNVDHVLEGSVRRAGDRIRVTAQLIDVHTDTHLWSETYTRELDDIFAVQDEIARAIVAALKVTLTGDEAGELSRRLTDNLEAYNRYLQGRQLWHQRGRERLLQSAQLLGEATALDPGFAEAWAALADAYVLLPEYTFANAIGLVPETSRWVNLARDASNRALELQLDSAQALTTRAYLRFMYEFDHAGAREDFERAIALQPNYPTARQWYGEFLAAQRDIEGALAEFARGAELDPLAPIMWHVTGWVLEGANRLEESAQAYQKALTIAPDFESAIGNLAWVYARLGRYDASRQHERRFLELIGAGQQDLVMVADALTDPVARGRFLEWAGEHAGNGAGFGLAQTLMLLDLPELAMDELETSLARGDPYAVHNNRQQIFDPLRENPRFVAYLRRMNLEP
jgi:TolB-like protein